MSSKLLPPDPQVGVEPVAWRLVDGPSGGGAPKPGPQAKVKPDALDAEKLKKIEQECEKRVQAARAAGAKEGEAAGREKAAGEMRAVMEKMARSIDEVASFKHRLRREAEADLIQLALAIARRVLHRAVAVDPEAMRGLVIAAMEKLKAREISQVRVHPNLAPMLADALRKLAPGMSAEIVPDHTRELGTLVFETTRGNLDASVEAQLEEIGKGLADRLQRNS